MFSVLLLGRNFPDAVGASTMERVIGGLGLVVVRRCFPVISTAFMTSLFDGIIDVWIFRCHDAETDHPNEHANRMIW